MKKLHAFLNKKTIARALSVFSALFICADVVAFLGENELAPLKLVDQGVFMTIKAIWPDFVMSLSSDAGKIVCVLVSLAIAMLWVSKIFFRTRIVLISHSTMNKDLEIDTVFKKEHWCKHFDVELNYGGDDISQLLSEQDEKAETIKRNIINKEKRPVFYYGIAHTPMIFRLGYQLSGKSVRFLHQYRVSKKEHCFSELRKYDEDRMPLNVVESVLVHGATDLLFGIGATYKIKSEDLDTIDPTHVMHRYNYTIEEDLQGFDFFSSENKIHSLVTSLVKYIEVICKENRVQRVHIAISASVAFTFLFAQRLSTNQIPEIVVYHYENGNSYPWGVCIKEKDANKAVVYTSKTEL